MHTEEDLDAIASVARERDLLVFADETYEQIIWGERRHLSIATREGMRERTVNLMGLTKSFSMGGWRVGFAVAAPSVLSAMVTAQQHLVTCPGSFAQAGAVVALRDAPRPKLRALWDDWEKRCRRVVQALDDIKGVSCEMPEGGFYAWAAVRPVAPKIRRARERRSSPGTASHS